MADREHLPWAEALAILRLIHRGASAENLALRSTAPARRLRARGRMSQAELARVAGMSASAVSRYEAGDRVPSPGQARRLVCALGYPPLLLDRALSFVAWARSAREASLTSGGGGFALRLEVLAGEVGLWTEELLRDALQAALGEPESIAVHGQQAAQALAPGALGVSDTATKEGIRALTRSGPPVGAALAMLRVIRGWEREDLARAAAISVGAITRYEHGKTRPALPSLRRLLAALAFPKEVFDRCLAFAVVARAVCRLDLTDGDVGAADAAAWEIAARKAQAAEDLARRELTDLATAVRLFVSRRAAPAAWALLADCTDQGRRGLVREVADFQTAGLCELLCQRSLDAAGDSAAEAARLADLAVEVAARVTGPAGFRSRLAGYAGAHRANASRVAGADLPAADEAFSRALELWNAGAADDDPGLLNAARVLHLEASLRRAQRRLPEALALLDRALALDRWGETPALLLGKARALVQLGEFEASIDLLRQASPQVDGRKEPRQRYVLCNLLGFNLCYLDRHAAAALVLPEMRALARKLGNRLDLLRVDWLAGRIAAGQGRTEEAIATLGRVREQFRALKNAYVVALLTVELAEVHAGVGRTAEVKALAREAAPLLADQGVHVEARRALALFCRAAEEERLSDGLLRGLIAYLDRARYDPQLRFEAVA